MTKDNLNQLKEWVEKYPNNNVGLTGNFMIFYPLKDDGTPNREAKQVFAIGLEDIELGEQK